MCVAKDLRFKMGFFHQGKALIDVTHENCMEIEIIDTSRSKAASGTEIPRHDLSGYMVIDTTCAASLLCAITTN